MTVRRPLKAAQVAGRTLHDPQRYRRRRTGCRVEPVGEPYDSMTAPQREAWVEFSAELPWLNYAHRAILQVACVLQVRIAEDAEPGAAILRTYSGVLAKLGAAPTFDQARHAPDDDANDDLDGFFN